jgi:hypothetical protein
MKQTASFSGWSIRDEAGTGTTWRIYEGDTSPLLASFLTPLTVSADDVSVAYVTSPWSGGSVSYSGFKSGEDASDLLGALIYGGSSQGAIAPGSYTISLVGGLYSNQQGYNITYVGGALTIRTSAALVAAANSKGLLEASKTKARSQVPETTDTAESSATATGCLAAMQDGPCVVR